MNKDLRNAPGFQKHLAPARLLGLILLIGAALRFYNLGAKSYWNDEIFSLIEGRQSIGQLIMSGKLDQPPAYYLPFHLWLIFFGTTEVATRTFSVLAGVGSIFLIYLVGQELFGKGVGLLSAFLMAISEFQIYYSQIARFYIFFEFMTLLSFLFFIMALRSKRTIHFALYGIASILMVYSHTFGIFILAAQDLFFVLQWNKTKTVVTPWLICQVLFLLTFMPDFYLLFFRGNGLGEAISANAWDLPTPSLLTPVRTVFHYVFSARRDRGSDIMLANYTIAGALLVTGALISGIRQGKRNLAAHAKGMIANLQEVPDVASKILFVSCWLLCPIILPLMISVVIRPIYAERYTVSAAPALYLLLAVGIFNIRKLVPVIVSLGVLVVAIAPSLAHYYVTPFDEQWKEVARFVEENSRPDEMIVLAPIVHTGITQETFFDWYYRGTLQSCGLSGELTHPDAISKALVQCTSGHDRFWVILSVYQREPASVRYQSFFQNPNLAGLRLLKEREFVNVTVDLFELKK